MLFAKTNGISILSNFLVHNRNNAGNNYDSIMDEKIENAGLDEKQTEKKFGKSLYTRIKEKLSELKKNQKEKLRIKK